MSTICGWMNFSGDPAEIRKILDRMLSSCIALPADRRGLQVLGESAVAFNGDPTSNSTYLGDSLAVVYSATSPGGKGSNSPAAVDAAALAANYTKHGVDFLRSLRGPFTVAVIDAKAQSAIIAIDPLGVQSLYYAATGGSLVFASRADSVAAHPAVPDSIDPQAVYDYLYFHMVPSPRSIFNSVHKLLPGQYVEFSKGRATSGFYWRLQYDDRNRTPAADLKQEFRGLLETCVARAAGSSATGCFLSGGTDSSTIVGTLARQSDAVVNTYSIGFNATGFDEIEYARLASRHFRTRLREYYVTPEDVRTAIPLVAQAYDEPFGNASAVPVYFCAKMARADGINTMLAGDGGDEIFAGNARYATQVLLGFYSRIPAAVRRALIEPVAFDLPGGQRIPPLRKLRSYIEQARIPMPERMETYNFLHRTLPHKVFSPDFLAEIDTAEPLVNLSEVYHRTQSSSTLNRMLHLDLKITLADNDLRKVNRMCRLAGVGIRYPLLDQEMVEFSARVPPALKLRHLKLRRFFKDALRDFLPREVLTKPKHGFGLPFGIWLAADKGLQELAYDSLLSLRGRGYLNPGYIDWLMEQHRSEHATYYGGMLWVLMMLEQWFTAQNR